MMLTTTRREYYNKESRCKRRAKKQKINNILTGIGIILIMLMMCIDWEMTLGL